MQPRLASSSKEALNLLEKGAFDRIILQVDTSLMDRVALDEGIIVGWRSFPIIMLASIVRRPDKGAYLTRIINPSFLYHALGKAFTMKLKGTRRGFR